MAQTFDTSDLRKGLKILIDGQPYIVVEAQFVKPGKGAAAKKAKAGTAAPAKAKTKPGGAARAKARRS